MRRHPLRIAVFAILCYGCGQPNHTESPVAQRAHAVDFVAYGTSGEFSALRSERVRQRIYEQNLALFEETEPASGMSYTWYFRSERSLAEKDAVAAELLDTHTGVDWIFARQKVAAPLLELHLQTESGDLGAIERYVRVLIETGNPSADLVASAFAVLGDRLSAEERGAGAAVTREAARAWLSQVDCDGCGAVALRTDSDDGGLPRKVLAVRDGLKALSVPHLTP